MVILCSQGNPDDVSCNSLFTAWKSRKWDCLSSNATIFRDKGKKYFQIFHFIYVTQGFLKTFDDIEL